MNLAVSELAFGYGGKTIGSDVSFSLAAGEVLCLLGPNGGGKTTLFKTLLGLLKMHGGSITVEGRDIRHWSRRRLAQVLAYVPQAHNAYFPFTVLDTVLMGRTARLGLFSTPSRRDVSVAETLLATLRIAELRDAAYTQISGGQRQLALIARALAQEPRWLIMDEPTASLDFGNQVRVLQHIKALARQGIGIVLSTHDPDHALACADRVALLHEGRLVRLGPPAEIITSESLRLIYGVDVEVAKLAESDQQVCVPRLMPWERS
ncbi:MAG: ABC transporter ATP-binding protein [Gammaproteobacteria bacterium]|nr:ABC transporter ATP-binding protein [Gammaproteobacteria bacterium]MCP5423897.1 ABC transporter ATP-binding protein [Gammaproteobacteria bacterium]